MQVSVCNARLRAVTREISNHFLLSPLSQIDIYKIKCGVCLYASIYASMCACDALLTSQHAVHSLFDNSFKRRKKEEAKNEKITALGHQ